MNKYFKICVEIEEVAAQVYRHLAKTEGRSERVKEVFMQLAAEEDEHAMQLRFAQRIFNPRLISIRSEFASQAQRLLVQAKNIQQQIKGKTFPDRRAIELGIEMENRFLQAHLLLAFDINDNKFFEMFSRMSKGDAEHVRVLTEAKETLNR